MKAKVVIPAGWKRVTHGKAKIGDRVLNYHEMRWSLIIDDGCDEDGVFLHGELVGGFLAVIRKVKP